MIEIKVEKSTCEHGASNFTASPEEICIGGINAAGVDKIHVTVPEEWAGCTVRITFNPHHAPRVARLLDKTGIITITDDMTIKERGKIVIDAQNADGYAAYSTDIRYTAYDHQRAGTASGQPSPSEYQQMIAMAAETVKSVNGVKPDENGDVQVQGGSVSDDQISQAVADYLSENPITGADGKDGVSVTHEWNGTILKVTSASGTSSADLKGEPGKDGSDGAPGSAGQDGAPGKDGTSPTISVSAITGGRRITITDVNGTKTVDVMDPVYNALVDLVGTYVKEE